MEEVQTQRWFVGGQDFGSASKKNPNEEEKIKGNEEMPNSSTPVSSSVSSSLCLSSNSHSDYGKNYEMAVEKGPRSSSSSSSSQSPIVSVAYRTLADKTNDGENHVFQKAEKLLLHVKSEKGEEGDQSWDNGSLADVLSYAEGNIDSWGLEVADLECSTTRENAAVKFSVINEGDKISAEEKFRQRDRERYLQEIQIILKTESDRLDKLISRKLTSEQLSYGNVSRRHANATNISRKRSYSHGDINDLKPTQERWCENKK